MRKLGIAMVLVGAATFLYCSDQMDEYPPLPTGLSIEEGWRYPQGRYQVAQYAAGLVAVVGVLFAMFPKGR